MPVGAVEYAKVLPAESQDEECLPGKRGLDHRRDVKVIRDDEPFVRLSRSPIALYRLRRTKDGECRSSGFQVGFFRYGLQWRQEFRCNVFCVRRRYGFMGSADQSVNDRSPGTSLCTGVMRGHGHCDAWTGMAGQRPYCTWVQGL